MITEMMNNTTNDEPSNHKEMIMIEIIIEKDRNDNQCTVR